MHEGLWEKLVALDPDETARRAKCEYISTSDNYVVVLLGRKYEVDRRGRRILSGAVGREGREANFLEQLCILAYLIGAREVPAAGKLVGAEVLEGGQFFFRGPHTLPTDKLVAAFGNDPTLLYKGGDSLGAKRPDYGDASIEISVLPRFGLTLVIWGADAEFSARASILFDQTANMQLPLDAIGAAVEIAVKAVISSVDNSN